MPDAMTATGTVTSDVAAYERLAYFALRPQMYFDAMCDVKPTRQTNPGATVTFQFWTEMAAVSAAIAESTDIDAVAIGDSQVTVTLAEYANAANTTFKVRATSFLEVDRDVANLIGYNAGISLDTVARNIVQAGTNVRYAGAATSRVTVAAAHTLAAANVRRAFTDLERANVAQFGGLYNAVIHPDVKYDLRAETGAAAWRDPHTYSQPNEIWTGEIGEFEGFRFISSPRSPVFVDAGVTSTVDVYRTLFMGRQAIAKAYSNAEGNGPLPRVIAGPVIDKLRRFHPLSWFWFGGYSVFRQDSLRAVESSSSIAVNV